MIKGKINQFTIIRIFQSEVNKIPKKNKKKFLERLILLVQDAQKDNF